MQRYKKLKCFSVQQIKVQCERVWILCESSVTRSDRFRTMMHLENVTGT